MEFVSVRVITDDIKRLVKFYEDVTGLAPTWYSADFAEFALSTPAAAAMLDLSNAFNNRAPQTINSAYGPAWLTPTTLLGGRLLKFGAQIDF